MDVVAAVREHLVGRHGGVTPLSASVTFLGLEPIDVLVFPSPDGDAPTVFATLGCSRHPMTDPTSMLADPTKGPRAELVLELSGGLDGLAGLYRSLAVLAASPAVEGVVLQADALIDLGDPIWEAAPFTAVLLGDSDIPELDIADGGEPVQFLKATPITATEAAWVRLRGAAALRDAWREADIDVRDPARAAAPAQ